MFNDDQNEIYQVQSSILNSPLTEPQTDQWIWNSKSKSCDVEIIDKISKCVLFHPNWSHGTSAIAGTKILNNTRSYWEIFLSARICGTSLMFGIGTKKTRLGSPDYIDLIGEDENSWGLSHKGLLWHDGKHRKFCRPFREHLPTTIGLLFDGVDGTLTYFKDGVRLGIGFRNLHKIKEPLYPIISSTAAKTKMTLQSAASEFVNLKDRCRTVILENLKSTDEIQNLPLPFTLKEYLVENAKQDENNFDECNWYVSAF